MRKLESMRDDQRNYILVGVFVIAMVAGLVLWIAMISGRTGATDAYTIRYDGVLGLAAGTQIYFDGYPIGHDRVDRAVRRRRRAALPAGRERRARLEDPRGQRRGDHGQQSPRGGRHQHPGGRFGDLPRARRSDPERRGHEPDRRRDRGGVRLQRFPARHPEAADRRHRRGSGARRWARSTRC